MTQRSYFEDHAELLRLGHFGDVPLREAQLGALHAIAAHFTVSAEPAIVSLPTGVGKTAVANATPFLFRDAKRVLIVEPSIVLRRQVAAEMESLEQLKQCLVLPDEVPEPRVLDLSGRPSEWENLRHFDVIVAHPVSIGPRHDTGLLPPHDLFDVVVFDEAHHIAAPTWRGILERFANARHVLLTATPYRRDRRQLPGVLVYDYPLTRAVQQGAYHPVELVAVPSAALDTQHRHDLAIRDHVVERLNDPQHAHSAVLLRASSTARAEGLVELYAATGVDLVVVHHGLKPQTVSRRLQQVQDGIKRGAAFVGLLGEGFDCARLKIGAYHDKHRSLPATLQYIGRLSRTTEPNAGPAEVVTTYEDLRSDTWELYRHDAVWSEIVPRLVEEASQEVRRRREFFLRLPELPLEDLSLHDLQVRRQTVLFDVRSPDGWEPDLSEEGLVTRRLTKGDTFAGGTIVWVAPLPAIPFLAMITEHRERPDWVRGPQLDSLRYELHTAAVIQAPLAARRLVMVTSNTRTNERRLAEWMSDKHEVRRAEPELVGSYMDIAQFTRYFGVGLRTTTATGSNRSYALHAGRQVDQGLAATDTRGFTLGHLAGEAELPDHRQASVGVSPGNARIWNNSYCHLDAYVEWLEDLAARLHHRNDTALQRLPNLSSPTALADWPNAEVLLVEPEYRFYQDITSVGTLEPGHVLQFTGARSPDDPSCLRVVAIVDDDPIWKGDFTTRWAPVGSHGDINIMMPGSHYRFLGDYLREEPPTVFWSDGTSTRGSTVTPPPGGAVELPEELFQVEDWSGVDITSETRPTTAGISIHQAVESRLMQRYGGSAWIIRDDGPGELADHVVIAPTDSGAIYLMLAHSKPSSDSQPGVRTLDLDVVLQHALRSRKWIEGGINLWREIARRIEGRASTSVITEDAFSEDRLHDACERWRFDSPVVRLTYVIVQPGLSIGALRGGLSGATAMQRQAGVAQSIHAAWTWLCGGSGHRLTIIASP